MKIILIVALLAISSSAAAQIPASPADTSIRDQIKAARAKDKIDEAAGSKERWWDRDANGKRPWNIPVKPTDSPL
jgi:hypothetical protein